MRTTTSPPASKANRPSPFSLRPLGVPRALLHCQQFENSSACAFVEIHSTGTEVSSTGPLAERRTNSKQTQRGNAAPYRRRKRHGFTPLSSRRLPGFRSRPWFPRRCSLSILRQVDHGDVRHRRYGPVDENAAERSAVVKATGAPASHIDQGGGMQARGRGVAERRVRGISVTLERNVFAWHR